MRTPITSMRTAAQLRCCAASHSPASRRNRRTLLGVTAWDTPPNWSLVRVFTSTNTTMRAASSAAITSSSPYRHRQLRVNTRKPSDVRWSTASCSPSAPISARVNVVMGQPSEPTPTAGRPERAVIPSHPSIHNRRAHGFATVKNGVYEAMVDNPLQGVADRATESDAFEYAARAGFAVSGVLHFLVAYIIASIAVGAGGNARSVWRTGDAGPSDWRRRDSVGRRGGTGGAGSVADRRSDRRFQAGRAIRRRSGRRHPGVEARQVPRTCDRELRDRGFRRTLRD